MKSVILIILVLASMAVGGGLVWWWEQGKIRPKPPKETGEQGWRGGDSGPVTEPLLSRVGGHVYGVFVGVGHYQYKKQLGLKNLSYAASDACQMYRLFVRWGRLKPSRARVLLSGEQRCRGARVHKATLSKVREALGDWLPRISTRADRVVIFYSGHSLNPQGKGLYLLFPGSQRERLHATAMEHRELKSILNKISARQQFVFLDSCYSGAKPKMLVVSYPIKELLSPGRMILSSSRHNERSIEDSNVGAGVFTSAMLKGLKGEADYDKNRIVDHLELSRYVMKWVPSIAHKIKRTHRQHPVLWGVFSGILPLIWLPGSSAPTPSSDD